MNLLLNPTIMRLGALFGVAVAAFVLGAFMIRRLRKDLVADSELPSQSPLTPDGLPVHSYHAVIQQLKQQKHELTALQQAERRKAKASDTLSAAVLANLSCGVLFLNASGLVRQANSAARKILGFASPIGMRISDLFHSSTLQSAHHDKINLEDALQPALKGESVVRGLTLNYASPDGQQRVIELTVSPVLAEKLIPGDHPVGTKRICVGPGYYETFNRDNVTLHDARDAAAHVDLGCTPHGTPASLRARTASTRLRGCGVPGSVRRHASSSSVPIENAVLTSVTSAASLNRSISRKISVPFVRIENGFR